MGTRDVFLSRDLAQAWLAYDLAVDVRAHHVACVLDIRGPLDAARFAEAARTVELRHEALRAFVRPAHSIVDIGMAPDELRPSDESGESDEARSARPGPPDEHMPRIDVRAEATFDVRVEPLAGDAMRAPDDTRARWIDSVMATRFDLGASCAAVRLARTGEERHTCVLVAARIACDASSLDVLADELVDAYAVAGAVPAPAPGCGAETPSFSRWLASIVHAAASERADTAVAEAADRLRGMPPAIDLPLDHPRPATWTGRGRTIERTLEADPRDALVRLVEDTGASHEVLVLTAWIALVQRLANQDDLVVGVACASPGAQGSPPSPSPEAPIAPRVGPGTTFGIVRPGIERTLPLREAVSRIDAAMRRAREVVTPFQPVVEALGNARDPSRTPIFQVAFESVAPRPEARVVAEVSFARERVAETGARADCVLRFAHAAAGDTTTLGLEYASDLFDEPSAGRMLDALAHAIRAMPSFLDQPIGRLPVLTPAERAFALAAVRTAAFDPERPVHVRFAAHARAAPDAVAAVMNDESIGYAELACRVNRLARRLVRAGVVRGSLVGIYCDRSIEMLVAMLAIHETGGAYVPLDPAHPPGRIAAILHDATPFVLLTDGARHAEAVALAASSSGERDATSPTVVALDDASLAEERADPLMLPVAPDSLAYVIFTSGSTGRPKGVEITHRAFTNFLEAMADSPGMGPADRILAVTTLSFDIAGLELMLPLFVGASVEIVDRATSLDAERLAARLDSSAITMLQATPTTYRMLVESRWCGNPRLRILCGGEPFPPDLVRALLGRVAAVWNVYGPTETTVWSTMCRLTDDVGSISVGRPLANTAIYVLDAYCEPVPVGAVGEIWIGGEGVARGYRGQPGLTAERFVEDPFAHDLWPNARMYRTGDLGRFSADGALVCLGRVDFQVKIRGFRIELGDIEAALLDRSDERGEPDPGVLQAVVVARDADADADADGSVASSGEKTLVAYLVLDRTFDADPATRITRVREALKRRLPAYMVPSAFVVLDALPLNPSGKIDRNALPPPPVAAAVFESESGGADSGRSAHEDDVSATIASVFADLLRTSDPDPDASFFDLGGNSLLAVRLVRQLELALGVGVPLAAVFAEPTIRALARTVRAAEPVRDTPSVVVLRRGTTDESLFCISGVALYQHLARAMPAHVTVYGVYVPAEAGIFEFARLRTGRLTFVGVDELAAIYVDVIRRTSPRGPYRLAGVSFGGIVAHAVAQKLRELGDEVQVLALLDALLPVALPGHPVRRLVRSASRWLRDADWRSAVGKLAHGRLGRATPGGFTDLELEALRDFVHEIEVARYFRRMTPYEGDVVVFSALDRREYGDLAIDAAAGWTRTVRGTLSRYDVPGGHLAILEPPNVGTLAARLAEHIR